MEFVGFLGNDALKARLSAADARGKLSHCYLISGPEGSGKHTLARILAAAMQCTHPARRPCGVCPACRKVFSAQHPDVITVRDPEHKQLAVDVVRAARADVFIRPNEGRRKIYIFDQPMAPVAQNALLKILEEPPGYAAFLLLYPSADALLATIRSRCAELALAPVTGAEALAFLKTQFPDSPDEALTAALSRAGGWLGQAAAHVRDEAFGPAAAQFAACFAAHDAMALLELLIPMEKYKREQLLPILEQLRQLLCRALAAKNGAEAARAPFDAICRARTGAEIMSAVQALQRAEDDLNANVGVGAVVGWLAVRLR